MIDGTKAFTTKSVGLSPRLMNEVVVHGNGKSITVPALWDTGATKTVISLDVVQQLQLTVVGFANIHTPSGFDRVNTYLVDIQLPNNLTIQGVNVSDSKIGDQGLGVLIGMDIITLGDFAVSNYQGKTAFSFRTPSNGVTDYVSQIRYHNTIGEKHGKGKRNRKK